MKYLTIIIILLILLAGCNCNNCNNRDTSKNTVIYEIFDDGNCGDLGFCPPPEGY